jgi:thiamine-monophosphate kinase
VDRGEDNLVAWLAERYGANGIGHHLTGGASSASADGGVVLGLGDDMAWVAGGGEGILLTVDMLMDGIHFDSTAVGPEKIGRKALAVSLSDCAAMAVRPCYVVVSVALPEAWSMAQAQALFLGMEPLAEAFGCAIIGGDTNSWSAPLVVDVTLAARPYAGVPPVRRNGAQPGDELWVTGRLGGSLRGHHLTFQPRVVEAHRLACLLGDSLRAMMDLSDGLSTDAPRMAKASGCGLMLDVAALEHVASEAASDAARDDGGSVMDHVLNDGEDFELFFAASPGAMERLQAASKEQTDSGTPPLKMCSRVGVAVEGEGVWMRAADGARQPIQPRGWQHFR